MSNPSGKKGTEWETAIVKALVAVGRLHCERRRLSGKADRGDIAGIPGIVIEAKNRRTMDLAGAVDEALLEARNDSTGVLGVSHGFAWLKRAGKTSPLDGYVVTDGHTFLRLLHEAGY